MRTAFRLLRYNGHTRFSVAPERRYLLCVSRCSRVRDIGVARCTPGERGYAKIARRGPPRRRGILSPSSLSLTGGDSARSIAVPRALGARCTTRDEDKSPRRCTIIAAKSERLLRRLLRRHFRRRTTESPARAVRSVSLSFSRLIGSKGKRAFHDRVHRTLRQHEHTHTHTSIRCSFSGLSVSRRLSIQDSRYVLRVVDLRCI